MDRRIELREFASIIAMFIFVQFAGLLFVTLILPPSQLAPITSSAATVSQSESGIPILVILVIELIAAAAFLIFLFKYVKFSVIFRFFGFFAIAIGVYFALWLTALAAFPQFSSSFDGYAELVIEAIITVILYLAMGKYPQIKNSVVIMSAIGLGAFGIAFSFSLAYFSFAVFAIYDYIAVFVTKHMLTLARMAMEYNMPLLVESSSVEILPKDESNKNDYDQIKKEISKGKLQNPIFKEIIQSGDVPVVSRVALGNGDLAIPLLFSVSAYITFMNFFIPFMMAIGAVFGLIFTFYILKKYKIALPALPPIFGLTNIALGITSILVAANIEFTVFFFAVGLISSYLVYNKAQQIYKSSAREQGAIIKG